MELNTSGLTRPTNPLETPLAEGARCALPLPPVSELESKQCHAQVSVLCQMRGGLLEEKPLRRKVARYCRDCALIVRRRKSAEWKRGERLKLGWRRYRDSYNPFSSEEEQREWRRSYMRNWRARRASQKVGDQLKSLNTREVERAGRR